MKKYGKQKVLNAIKLSNGVISRIASRLGCNWHTAKSYIEKWDETKEAFQDEEENILDLAEDKVHSAIKEGDPWAIKFVLSTKGKKRGYSEKIEIGNPEGESFKTEDSDEIKELRSKLEELEDILEDERNSGITGENQKET